MSRPNVTVGEGQVAAAPQTPTQQVVADANRVVEVVDARGRKIGVRRLGMSVRRRVFKAIPGQSENARYLTLACYAACVVTLNGQNADALEMIGNSTKSEANEMVFDDLLDRLDDDGYEAVRKAVDETLAPVKTKDEIKNS